MELVILFGTPDETLPRNPADNSRDFETFFELTIMRYDKSEKRLVPINVCILNFDLGLAIDFNN